MTSAEKIMFIERNTASNAAGRMPLYIKVLLIEMFAIYLHL
jgi:hypothetical protein